MSYKTGLIFTFTICILSNFYCTAKDSHNAYQDSLFQEKFYSKGAYEDADRIISSMPNDTESNELLLKFIEKCPTYRNYAEKKLVLNNYSKLIPYLNTNKDKLLFGDWEAIIEALETKKGLQVDSSLNKILHTVSSTSPSADIRGIIRLYFYKYGKLTDIISLAKYLDVETNNANRQDILGSLTRFKHDSTDSILAKNLISSVDFYDIELLVEFGLQKYNRYDLLPAIYTVRDSLMAIKNLSLVEKAKNTVQVLDNAIKILEQKKAEKAPIGLPLSWPDEPVKK